jgi:hypothetical protein
MRKVKIKIRILWRLFPKEKFATKYIKNREEIQDSKDSKNMVAAFDQNISLPWESNLEERSP